MAYLISKGSSSRETLAGRPSAFAFQVRIHCLSGVLFGAVHRVVTHLPSECGCRALTPNTQKGAEMRFLHLTQIIQRRCWYLTTWLRNGKRDIEFSGQATLEGVKSRV